MTLDQNHADVPGGMPYRGPRGPFDTEDQARTHPAVRAVYEAARASSRRGAMQDPSEALITGACEAAGVALGEYDARIVRWVAGFEPQACAVIAGLIIRAAEAGRPGGQTVAFDLSDADGEAYFVLTTALRDFAGAQRGKAADECGGLSHERWADRADVMRSGAEAAAGGAA